MNTVHRQSSKTSGRSSYMFRLRPSRCSICLAAWCAAFAIIARPTLAAESAAMTTTAEPTPSASNVFQLNPSPSHQPSSKFSITNNLPVQLAIIVGSVVLAATCIASLAWIVCSRRKGKKGSLNGGIIGFSRQTRRTGTQRHSFDPSKPGSVYDFGEADSIDGLSLKEKSDVSSDHNHGTANQYTVRGSHNRASFLSPVSPMPALKIDDTQAGSSLRNPTLATKLPNLNTSSHRGNGWQLNDGRPIDGASVDIEANGSLPRRPSFIERLMTHRSMTMTTGTHTEASRQEANAEALSDPAPWQADQRSGDVRSSRMPERSFTTPAALLGGGPMMTPATPVATTGSVLLSALGGAFRRVSQHHQHYTSQARRKFAPSPRQMPIESDFEGTIGANDADLPMARRSKKRQMLCGESIRSPSVATPMSMDKTPQIVGGNTSTNFAKTFARSPLSRGDPATMQQYATLTPANGGVARTPGQFTPGLAGLGTNWPRRMSETAVPLTQNVHRALLSDEKRHQDWQDSAAAAAALTANVPSSSKGNRKGVKLRNWVAETQFAAVPPPDTVSRRGSDISFVISERSMPSVSRQNSVVQWHLEKALRQEKLAANVVGKENDKEALHRVASLNPRFAATTQLDSWLDPTANALTVLDEGKDDEETINGEQIRSPVTDYDRSRGTMLWEDIPAQPSQQHGTTAERRSKKSKSSSSSSMHKRTENTKPELGGTEWVNDEVADVDPQHAAQIRAEKQMRKRMRKARRAAKRAARQAAMLEANKAVTSLPAVRHALRDTGDTTATSDSNKGQEQAARQRVLVDDGASLIDENGNHHQRQTDAVAWVEDFLMNTPQMHAPVFVQPRPSPVPSSVQRQHTVGRRCKRDERSRAGRSLRRTPTSTRRRFVARPMSPPESPLTSASEYVRSPNVEQHQRRRSSMPTTTTASTASTHSHGDVRTRSFLVESRRGSKDTNVTTSSSAATSASQRSRMSKSRVISLPACALTPIADEPSESTNIAAGKSAIRRQLPMPPIGMQGRPLSAFEQIAQR